MAAVTGSYIYRTGYSWSCLPPPRRTWALHICLTVVITGTYPVPVWAEFDRPYIVEKYKLTVIAIPCGRIVVGPANICSISVSAVCIAGIITVGNGALLWQAEYAVLLQNRCILVLLSTIVAFTRDGMQNIWEAKNISVWVETCICIRDRTALNQFCCSCL